jgi:HAD superfamily hydrolase (TIGR01490 family)
LNHHVAFFDLDHTILDINSGVIMVKEAHRKGLIRKADFISALLLSVFYKAGFLNAEFIMKRMAAWLNGTSEQKFIQFADQVFEQHIRKAIRKQAREMVKYHQNNGGRSVLLSASTPYVCDPVKNTLQLDDIICSKLEVIDGHFSGNPEGKYCYGAEKLVRTIQYCHENKYDLSDAYYYADSHSDLDVLKAIGHPQCVTPDKKLRSFALKNGWDILNW